MLGKLKTHLSMSFHVRADCVTEEVAKKRKYGIHQFQFENGEKAFVAEDQVWEVVYTMDTPQQHNIFLRSYLNKPTKRQLRAFKKECKLRNKEGQQ
jgi:hypothetical protein